MAVAAGVVDVHVIDPDSDTVIVLRNPVVDFAVWVEKGPELEEWASVEPTEEPEREIIEDEPTPPPEPEPPATPTLAVQSAITQPADRNAAGFHFYVSSRHLKISSVVFRKMLSDGSWLEGKPNDSDGRLYLYADGWDSEAFLILMRIIHTRSQKVPKAVTLDMLTKISVIVDYYNMEEAVEPYPEIWIAKLRETTPIPKAYCRDLIQWICVAWVFKQSQEFKETTSIALRQSTEPIQFLELPIPPAIQDEINHRRQKCIKDIISVLHRLLDQFRSSTYTCSSMPSESLACGGMLLGTLIKQMDSFGFYTPRPEAPFIGFSFASMSKKMRNIQSPNWHGNNGYHSDRECDLKTSVCQVLNELEKHTESLEPRWFAQSLRWRRKGLPHF